MQLKTAYVGNLVKVHYMTYSIDPYPTYTKTNKHVKPWIGQPTAMQGPKIIENCIIWLLNMKIPVICKFKIFKMNFALGIKNVHTFLWFHIKAIEIVAPICVKLSIQSNFFGCIGIAVIANTKIVEIDY